MPLSSAISTGTDDKQFQKMTALSYDDAERSCHIAAKVAGTDIAEAMIWTPDTEDDYAWLDRVATSYYWVGYASYGHPGVWLDGAGHAPSMRIQWQSSEPGNSWYSAVDQCAAWSPKNKGVFAAACDLKYAFYCKFAQSSDE